MQDLQQAQNILNQAHQLLAQRLCRFVLDDQDGLIQDARGDSYMDEIATIYDQVGTRMSKIGAMQGYLQLLAKEPSPGPSSSAAGDPVTFKEYAQLVAAGDTNGAAGLLVQLLGIRLNTAIRCSEIYADRLDEYPNTIARTMEMRTKIAQGNHNGVILILLECFALSGTEAIAAVTHLSQRFAA